MAIDEKNKVDLFKKLPSDIREMLVSVEKIEIIDDTAKKYNLNQDQNYILENAVNSVLYGFLKKDRLSIELSEKLKLDEKKSAQIVQIINKNIFEQLKNSLEALAKDKETSVPENQTKVIPIMAQTTTGPFAPQKEDAEIKIPTDTKEILKEIEDIQSPFPPADATSATEKKENLDIDKVLKEIEGSEPEHVATQRSSYALPTPMPEIKIGSQNENKEIKSIFERKLENFYQTPETMGDVGNVPDRKTGSAPVNLPKESSLLTTSSVTPPMVKEETKNPSNENDIYKEPIS